jgi:DNA-binding GntR family transcriptional regulator
MRAIAPAPSVTTRAAEEIRAAISSGSLAPGSRMRQEELAAKLGVSREPIRKALLLLEREGLVDVVKRGAIVALVDPIFITEIFELRETIESYVVAKIAEKKDLDLSFLRNLIPQGRRAVSEGLTRRLIELDETFHCELYRASDNRVVLEIMQTHWSHIRRIMSIRATIQSSRTQVWDEHEAILDAIGKRDIALARNVASGHVRSALRAVLTALHEEAAD